jgi:hypothetical protein
MYVCMYVCMRMCESMYEYVYMYTFIYESIHPSVYKTHLAKNRTHRNIPNYQLIFHMGLRYGLYTEVHYSLWANDMYTFRGYWLHRNILGKIHD